MTSQNRNNAETLHIGGLRWRRYPADATKSTTLQTVPIVILHGLFGSGDNWQSQARALSHRDATDRAREVLVPDLPNHGDSEHTDRFTYREIAVMLWDALDQIGIHTVTRTVELLGHSMGGKVAMAMALDRPERVSRLVVVDIAPQVYAPRHHAILEGMRAVAAAGTESRGEAERMLAETIPEKPVRLFLLKSLVPDDDGTVYRWKLNLEGIIANYDAISDWPYEHGQYTGPTLFIRGERSPYIDENATARITAFFPHAVITTIAGAGHWVHAEQRDTFLSVVREEDS